MKPEEINIGDWQRILIGEVPPSFLLEVIFRIAVVYLILMMSMRLLGKRMAAQLTRNELAAMASLAAAIGVPILSPDRGVLPAFVIALVVVSISRLIAIMSSKNEKTESITRGSIDTLVKDAVMDVKAMTKTRLSKERVMSQLRTENVRHLGEVKRLFIEANGTFTLIKATDPKPGLPVIPEIDREFLKELKPNGILVCRNCGQQNRDARTDVECVNCKSNQWVKAVE